MQKPASPRQKAKAARLYRAVTESVGYAHGMSDAFSTIDLALVLEGAAAEGKTVLGMVTKLAQNGAHSV